MDAQLNLTGRDIHKRSGPGVTALHIAVGHNLLEAAKWLINEGADLEAMEHGDTPLHYTTTEDNVDAARLLISHGAKVDAQVIGGWTPLHSAAYNNALKVAKLLIDNGADKNAKISGWGNAKPIDIARRKGHSKMVALLQ